MKAMILAAGEGTRLRPLTLETPKVLLPVAGIPLIEYTLIWLKSHGISKVAVNLYHLGDKIKDFIRDGSRFGVNVFYSREETLLGTAGGVKRLEGFFNSTFIAVYGDILTDFDLTAMVQFHQQNKAIATLAIFEASSQQEAGIVKISKKGRILSLVEKPRFPVPNLRTSVPILANGGVYVLEKEILDHIPSQAFCDFAYHVFPKLIKLGLPLYGYLLKPEDYLIDIGTLDKYHRANEQFKKV